MSKPLFKAEAIALVQSLANNTIEAVGCVTHYVFCFSSSDYWLGARKMRLRQF
ncbi:hypothetical protein COO91_08011 [Nostoc flagelliforme CCNUN1]|uniref:Uncharacterized protein n=1 Tax=Nostoc flagelliforme CCNUN1 TaxID=2038116 RepID=A0A2K8T2T2_9NOSO|nr:hypothetical protein COO91_08011 [Nostoc flagelliforme CCNUN1]